MFKRAQAPNLFWQTFILLILFITFCVIGWIQSFRVLNEAPYSRAQAQQIVSMVNLTRYALISADPIYRPDLLMVLASREGLRILPKEPTDKYVLLVKENTYAGNVEAIDAYVKSVIGADTVLAGSVNGEKGLWVSIALEGDQYWLMTSGTLLNPPYGKTWIWWALAALVASIMGAVLLAGRLNKPLKTLSEYAMKFGRGEIPHALPENKGPVELREVNSSFNRMVQDFLRVEKDREVLLAGVSHDLRTPITRLRLETELADLPEETHKNMVSDLEQMENIVNQFMDYAKQSSTELQVVDLGSIVASAVEHARLDIDPGVRFRFDNQRGVFIRAHTVEMGRVVQNLITNAQRYGKSDDGVLDLSISLTVKNKMAELTVCDFGIGLDMSQADRMMRPFERGDSARGGTNGTGLGLAIVDRIVKRSSGHVKLKSSIPHGLTVLITIPTVAAPAKKAA